MLYLTTFVVLATTLFKLSQAAPVQIERRIDQITSDAKGPWEQACLKAGGTRDECSNVAVPAAQSLLEAGGVCDQQKSADSMIDLAKQLGNDPEMIRLAQIFAQQPRNSPEKSQVPYCQVAPKNAELNGLFHCQFSGSDFTKFGGDQTGNVPLGLKALSPAGSCPANPNGPVPDGEQLNTLVQNPIAAGSTVETTPSAGNSAVPSQGGSGSEVPDSPPPPTSSASGNTSGTANSGSSCSINP
ncbi:hypothetical protein GALMADRAFT_253836 [Galerina marginata CBS 339.88]|uniref:Uncharacterized protein n=1 Tax=Galerina marginata (strain CBS 339.88) TaxID=685588 RepID=A0A067SKR1_GALM3|nr:hypothetical protein GALMADRAFT_253836 [Galerina marginata CBS 339.88]